MKILHTVGFYEPHKGGSEEVVRQLSERLVNRGHEVTVATSFDPGRTWTELNGVNIETFRVFGNSTLGISGESSRYVEFLKSFRPDVMLNYAAQIWTTDLAFGVLDDLQCVKVMVPCGYLLSSPTYTSYYADLPNHLKKYDALVYMSRNYQDKRFGDEVGVADKAVIIPNGAAAEEFEAERRSFRKTYGIDSPFLVLTVSNHHDLKGHRHIIQALKSLRRKDATLVILGNRAGHLWQGCYVECKLRSMIEGRIRILENVPREFVVSAFHEADVFVLASEIECAPLVIYETMAAGTPFVSTNCGNVSDNKDFGIVVDEAARLGPALSALLEDPERRAVLGGAGQAMWRDQHTWSTIAASYERLYGELVSQRNA